MFVKRATALGKRVAMASVGLVPWAVPAYMAAVWAVQPNCSPATRTQLWTLGIYRPADEGEDA